MQDGGHLRFNAPSTVYSMVVSRVGGGQGAFNFFMPVCTGSFCQPSLMRTRSFAGHGLPLTVASFWSSAVDAGHASVFSFLRWRHDWRRWRSGQIHSYVLATPWPRSLRCQAAANAIQHTWCTSPAASLLLHVGLFRSTSPMNQMHRYGRRRTQNVNGARPSCCIDIIGG